MIEIYKLSGFQQELDKAERFFSMHLTRQELKSRLDKIENQQKEIERLNNIINELEKDVENRLMSIPNDMCDDALEEIKRTTKIAVYQVVLGKLQELKGDGGNE